MNSGHRVDDTDIKDKKRIKFQFLQFFQTKDIGRMDMQQAQMELEQQDYQSTYSSSQANTLSTLLLVPSDDKLIDLIYRLKSSGDKFVSLEAELKQYAGRNKNSIYLKKLQERVLNLMNNLKVDGQYAFTEGQKNIIWFFNKLCSNDRMITIKQRAEDTLIKIFNDFTTFDDFTFLLRLFRVFCSNNKFKSTSLAFAEKLHYLYFQKYEKFGSPENGMKFAQTMKNLDEQKKLIVKTQIISYFTSDTSKFKVEETQIHKILAVLNNKPYKQLFEAVIEKRFKPVKQLRTSILKTKMQLVDGKVQLMFGAKCQLCKQLKTKQIFELTARKCDGSQLIPQIQADSLMLHGDYLYTKWSPQILVSSRQKVNYDSTQQQINEGFLKLLSFLKKIFQHKNKVIQGLQSQNKMIEQGSQDKVPKQTRDYFCQAMQLFIKYLSFNSLQINHRSHNLSQIIPVTFLDEILSFFEEELRNKPAQKIQQKRQDDKQDPKQQNKQQKNIVNQTIDYVITFIAHLFYRRDFQSITAISTKTSQTIIKILLETESFPTKWNVLRNYKLVIDRWGQSVEEGSQDYKKLAKKFLDAYFSDKITVFSKSSSTVFNPIFITRPYCKIFGSQFLKCIQNFEKSLDQLDAKNMAINVSRQMNSTMSKIILFMSSRVRFQDANKIAEHLGNIYRKYAHTIPEIYLFRAWIMQVNFTKTTQSQISVKLTQTLNTLNLIQQRLKALPASKLLTPLYHLKEQQDLETVRLLNLYKFTHNRSLNALQLKSKTQQYGYEIFRKLWEITQRHIDLVYLLNTAAGKFQKQSPEQHKALKEQSDLLRQNGVGSLLDTVQKIKMDFLFVVRYYICNAGKMLSPKDYSVLVRAIGEWVRKEVEEAEANEPKFPDTLRSLAMLISTKLSPTAKSHLMKKQILGAMRALNGGEQLDLSKSSQVPFNQVSSLYQQLKPVYVKLIKLLIQPYQSQLGDPAEQKQLKEGSRQILQKIVIPTTNIFGPGYFNGKIQQKVTEDMVLGIYMEQADAIFNNFSFEEIYKLNERYLLMQILQVTRKKAQKIVQTKNPRSNNQRNNIFRAQVLINRESRDAIQQLRQVNIPEEYIQIALENIEQPDAQLALQWIQNNHDRIQTLIMEKALKQSKEQTMMRPLSQPKSQVGKVTPLKFNQFIDKLEKILKLTVKTLAKQLFSQNGKNIAKILFIILDAFKDDFKKKQHLNLGKKMFEQINGLNSKQKFDDKKYRMILRILMFTIRKQPSIFNDYYKEGICIKVLSFVGSFANSLTQGQQKAKQRKEDFILILKIINQTLPQWKSPLNEIKPELNTYLGCLLDVIELSNLGSKDVWEILYKIGILQNKQLNQKVIKLFSTIVISKGILQEQIKNIKQKTKQSQKNLFTAGSNPTLPIRTYMLPLAKILLQQNKKLLLSNIQLQIKGYIVQNYKEQLMKLKQKKQKQLLQIDLKRFSLNFDKFVNCKEFEQIFKKLFSKKKSKKNTLFYDIQKHSLFESQFPHQSSNKKPFILMQQDESVLQILKTFLTRPVFLNQFDKESQEQALTDLYKLLDYFKVLIPAVLRIQWVQDSKTTNLLEWVLTKSTASNKKRFQFLVFLAMNNHLMIDEKSSISDYVSHQYLQIIKREVGFFADSQKEKMKENQFREESLQQGRFKKILFSFLYLLQIQKFNTQCFLKLSEQTMSMVQLLSTCILSVSHCSSPLLYTLLSECLFILKKREMIQRLKQKYLIIQKQQPTQSTNIYTNQFLHMQLIYKVEPNNGSGLSSTLSKKKKNIFSGSNGRIVVDEVEDDYIDWDEMDQMSDQYDSITNLLRMRFRQRDVSRINRNQNSQEYELYPIETIDISPEDNANNAQLINSQLQQNPSQMPQSEVPPQINQQPLQNNQANKQKIQEQPKPQEYKKQVKKIDYLELLQEHSKQLTLTLNNIRRLLPSYVKLEYRNIAVQTIGTQELQKIVEQKPVQCQPQNVSFSMNTFTTSLAALIQTMSVVNSSILPQGSKYDSQYDIKPQFSIRLVFNEGLQKLAKYERRFKTLMTCLCPQITSKTWQNQHSLSVTIVGKSNVLAGQLNEGQVPSARWLLARLQRQDGSENRDQMIYHVERLINQRRQQSNQQNTRVRTLNLNQAIQELPEQPQTPKIVQQKPKVQEKKQEEKQQIKPQVTENIAQNKIEEPLISQEKSQEKVQEKAQEKAQQPRQQTKQSKEDQAHSSQKPQKMQQQKPEEHKNEQKSQDQNSQMVQEQSPLQQQANQINQQQIVAQEPPAVNPVLQEVINQPQPQQIGSYRQILAMFRLAQTFLADNGIDPQSFDSLPEQFQIDQITHYMSQAQNRVNVNQLNQANMPPQQQQNIPLSQGQVEGEQHQQPGNGSVNEVLQQNIALFASMDPQTRAEMLMDYPQEFLIQLPVQMRTQLQQFRQRQLHRIVEQDQQNGQDTWRRQLNSISGAAGKKKNLFDRKMAKYPSPGQINFNPITESVARQLSQCIFLKVAKLRTLQGFRILLQNYLTQPQALATILGVLRIQQGIKITEVQHRQQQNEKGYWRCETVNVTDSHQLAHVKEGLLNLVFQALNNQLYKDQEFLKNKTPYLNYLDLEILPIEELQADQEGFWPLFELLPYSLELSPKLTVQILKRVKQLPLRLIKKIVEAIRAEKLSPQIYKQLQFLSKNQDMKKLFMQEFPEERPLKLQIFAKVIKYNFARVPYLRKLHEEALNYYSGEYNQFLNQIFGIYSMQDIKEIESILIKHKHVHFKVIKYLYSQNRVLDNQPIGLVLKMPHLLDFETKKYLFQNHPKIRKASRYRLPIEVSRGGILQESFNQIMSKTPKQLEGRIQISFIDEPGYDAGGLKRQWLECLSKQIFRPDYALFEPSSSGNTYQPNPKSFVNPDHLKYFKFIGRLVGKALAQKQLMGAYFTRAFYKMILGQQVQLSDLEQQDYFFYKSMLWLKQNTIQEGDYTFSYLYDNFGQKIAKELIPGGKGINVTQENKLQYIQKYCLAKMRDDFKAQMQKFLEGFHEVIPHECISFFEAKELQLLISGLPEIDFEDLKKNVDYSGFSPADQAIKWFWEVLEEFSKQDLARLIQFTTGTSRIPVGGFANLRGINGLQRISIHKDPNGHQLPKAHTCFNQFDLPNYLSKEVMRQRIVTAITWGSQGFGFM